MIMPIKLLLSFLISLTLGISISCIVYFAVNKTLLISIIIGLIIFIVLFIALIAFVIISHKKNKRDVSPEEEQIEKIRKNIKVNEKEIINREKKLKSKYYDFKVKLGIFGEINYLKRKNEELEGHILLLSSKLNEKLITFTPETDYADLDFSPEEKIAQFKKYMEINIENIKIIEKKIHSFRQALQAYDFDSEEATTILKEIKSLERRNEDLKRRKKIFEQTKEDLEKDILL